VKISESKAVKIAIFDGDSPETVAREFADIHSNLIIFSIRIMKRFKQCSYLKYQGGVI